MIMILFRGLNKQNTTTTHLSYSLSVCLSLSPSPPQTLEDSIVVCLLADIDAISEEIELLA